ncbi:MAG: hypothetical protein OHK0039_35280 [Bacteroidia bacterium]
MRPILLTLCSLLPLWLAAQPVYTLKVQNGLYIQPAAGTYATQGWHVGAERLRGRIRHQLLFGNIHVSRQIFEAAIPPTTEPVPISDQRRAFIGWHYQYDIALRPRASHTQLYLGGAFDAGWLYASSEPMITTQFPMRMVDLDTRLNIEATVRHQLRDRIWLDGGVTLPVVSIEGGGYQNRNPTLPARLQRTSSLTIEGILTQSLLLRAGLAVALK